MRGDRAEARRLGGNRRGSKVSAAQTWGTMSAHCGGSSESHSCMDSTADDKSAATLLFTFYRKYADVLARTWTSYLHVHSRKRLSMHPFHSIVSKREKDHPITSD